MPYYAYGLQHARATLSANVTMTTAGTIYVGPSVSLTAGTWRVYGIAQVQNTATGSVEITAQIYNSTSSTALAAHEHDSNAPGTDVIGASVTAYVTLTAAATIQLQAVSSTAGCTLLATATYNGVTNTATGIWAERIG